MTGEKILDKIASLIQSRKSIEMYKEWNVMVKVVQTSRLETSIAHLGAKRVLGEKAENWLIRVKSHLAIDNRDNLCLVRALAVAKLFTDKKAGDDEG